MVACALVTLPTAGFADAPPLEIYGRLPGLERATISQSGDHIAVLATVGDVRQVLVLDSTLKVISRFAIDAQSKVRGLTWAGDQILLIDISHTVGLDMGFTADKAELFSVTVMPLGGAKAWGLFVGNRDITGGVWGNYGVVQKNGHWFGYFGAITTKGDGYRDGYGLPDVLKPDLYEVDLETHLHRKIARKTEDGHDHRSWLVDDKGAVGAVLDIQSASGQWAITTAQYLKLASGVDRDGNVGLIGFTADGTGVIYSVRETVGGEDRYFSVPLVGGAAQPLLEHIAIDRWVLDSGHRLIGYIERNATSDAHFFDARQDKIYKASQRAFPGSHVELDDANRAFDRLLLTTEGPGDPETWWMVNIATGHADPLGYSYTIEPAQVGPMRMVAYTAADGLKMEGVLTLPPDRPGKALPAVILPHGGPAAYDTARFDWLPQAFASRGYAVFQPNFRGSTGYGAAFENAGKGEWGRKMQTDISDGLSELVRQGVVDPKRVCIVGASYGGYAALAGVTLQHGIYRCAVADAGISDVERMAATDTTESGSDPMLTRWLKRELGTGRDMKAVSPIRFVGSIDAPVLLIHGKDDTVVNFAQSTDMLDAMRKAGKPVEMVTLLAEDHWLSKSATRLQMLQASVDFVIKHNPPDAAPVSAPIATKQ